MSEAELDSLAKEAWSLTEIGKSALKSELLRRGLEIELAKSGVVAHSPEVRFILSKFSRKDRIALLIASGFSLGYGYFASLFPYAFLFVAAPFVILVIPSIVIFAEQRKLLVWQVCILSFVFPPVFGILQETSPRRAYPVIFLIWALVTVFSSPIPVGFYLLRLKGEARHFACIGLAVVGLALALIAYQIMNRSR